MVSGEAILATAITEPDAGSDVTGVSTTAVQQGDQWVINGSKMFCTNGDLAKYVIVYVLTNPDHPSRHSRHSFIIVDLPTSRVSRPTKSTESSGHPGLGYGGIGSL